MSFRGLQYNATRSILQVIFQVAKNVGFQGFRSLKTGIISLRGVLVQNYRLPLQ